jgi:hypothetical protein
VVLAVALVCSAGCQKKGPDPSGALTQAQIDEIVGFGKELKAQFGDSQPPVDTWAAAMPWLKFKGLELRPDGTYFIVADSETEESGYVVADTIREYYEAHNADPAFQKVDGYLWRYRISK